MKKSTYITGIIGIILVGSIIFFSANISSFENIENYEGEIKIYRSSSCGCCGIYGTYFQGKGNSNAQIISTMNLDSIKDESGVPGTLTSCHTTIIGDYFVEGHVPLEAIEKLISEKPDIAGIAMPGMPSGSPGMPGPKLGDFIIYAVNKDGTYGEFMRI